MAEYNRFIIGVDGGGTKTHVLVVGLDGTVVSEETGGPSNIQTVGISQAVKTVFELIHKCCTKIKCSAEKVERIVIGLAGAGRLEDRTVFIDTMFKLSLKKKFPLKNIILETDARIALESAFAGGHGIVLIAGTGSIALYRTEDGYIARTGGWGNVIGDEGGGYSIAKDALCYAMRSYDGRIGKTILLQKMLNHFALASPEEIIKKVYYDKIDIATFAPTVIESAVEMDQVAYQILLNHSNHLIEMVRTLVMKYPLKKKLPVALMGGLIETDNYYSKLLNRM